MEKPQKHPEEKRRLEVLKSKNILDSEPDPRFDAITRKATTLLAVPISTVSIIDEDREWFKSCVGLDQSEGPRDVSFCGHALLSGNVFICENTLEDDRFKDNPYVVGKPHIRFYAGIRLLDKKTGLPMGVFCVKDNKTRHFSIEELERFINLGKEAEELLNNL